MTLPFLSLKRATQRDGYPFPTTGAGGVGVPVPSVLPSLLQLLLRVCVPTDVRALGGCAADVGTQTLWNQGIHPGSNYTP